MRIVRFIYLLFIWQACALGVICAQESPVDSLAAVQPAVTVPDNPEEHPPFRDSTTATPYHTIYHHLYYTQAATWNLAEAARALYAPGADLATKQELARQLKRILDARGLFVYLEELPRTPCWRDTTRGGAAIYVLFDKAPEIYLQQIRGKWLYSRKTTEAIPELYAELYPLGLDALIDRIPEAGKRGAFGLALWQAAGFVLLMALALALYFILRAAFLTLIRRVIARLRKLELAPGRALPTAKPAALLIAFLFFQTLTSALQLPVKWYEYGKLAGEILAPLLFVVVLFRLVSLTSHVFSVLAEKTEGALDDQLVPLIDRIAKVMVVLAGGLFIVQNLGYDITTLLAGLSIGGLAVALAAQDTLKNFFGSVMIFVDRPFQIGDWIRTLSVEGVVEEVGLRATRIRTFENSVVYVPNGKLTDTTVDNMGMRVYRRFKTRIALTYESPPNLIEAFVEGLRELVRRHPHTRKDLYEIHLNEMGAHSLDVLFYIFFDCPNWTAELTARQELILAIMRLANELGLQFAFPTQTLHIETQAPAAPLAKVSRPADAHASAQAFVARQEAAWTSAANPQSTARTR